MAHSRGARQALALGPASARGRALVREDGVEEGGKKNEERRREEGTERQGKKIKTRQSKVNRHGPGF